jgi:gamma-glutamylcyclotransferase (GGCT)/AIG2-like uncharacterized protein YtfP
VTLFGYGTFRRESWRRAIFGADYAAEPATLSGWRRASTPSGYLSLVRAGGACVHGIAIALDEAGWKIADAWEDVPLYRRIGVEIATAGGLQSAGVYVYAHAGTLRPVPIDDDALALLDDAAVEAAIARFVPRMRAIRAALDGDAMRR